jgi:DNA-binding transcriptional ArsR family regulator
MLWRGLAMVDNDDCRVEECVEFKVNIDRINKVRESMIEDSVAVKLSEFFKALGDPTRIKIIYVLSKSDMCVCDIAETLNMKQSAISHQLRVLRSLRFVKYRKEGKSVIYSLDDDHVLYLFSQGMEHIKHS